MPEETQPPPEPEAKQPKLFTRAGLIAVMVVVGLQLVGLVVFALIWKNREPEGPETLPAHITVEVPIIGEGEGYMYVSSDVGPQRSRFRVDYSITVGTDKSNEAALVAAVSSSKARISTEIEDTIRRMSYDDARHANTTALKEKVKRLLEDALGVEGAVEDVYISWKAN